MFKIAIHPRKDSFSERWIKYCEDNSIPFKIVNCYDNDIIQQLKGCKGLMWHWSHMNYRDMLFAKQLTISLEQFGISVYPDVNTSWHFDDKIGQKYLLEAINAPFINTNVFYSKTDALNWLESTSFPKVFKLRGGAGSLNVTLIHNKKNGEKVIEKAFSKGFRSTSPTSRMKERFYVLQRDRNIDAAYGLLNGLARFFIPTTTELFSAKEKGYVYFQDFLPGNDHDIRLVIIGNRCFGMRRGCRPGDFRASGSGIMNFEPNLFDAKAIKIAFDVSKNIGSKGLYFDFIFDNGQPKIIEISYCSKMAPYDACPGYWDSKLIWHKRTENLQTYMIEEFLKSIEEKETI